MVWHEVDFDEIELTAEPISISPLGDVNLDGVVNGLDVDPFVAAVVGGGSQQVPRAVNPPPRPRRAGRGRRLAEVGRMSAAADQ